MSGGWLSLSYFWQVSKGGGNNPHLIYIIELFHNFLEYSFYYFVNYRGIKLYPEPNPQIFFHVLIYIPSLRTTPCWWPSWCRTAWIWAASRGRLCLSYPVEKITVTKLKWSSFSDEESGNVVKYQKVASFQDLPEQKVLLILLFEVFRRCNW